MKPCITSFSKISNLFISYETHSVEKRPNAALCKRMRSATDKSKINSGCMRKHTREKKATLFLL